MDINIVEIERDYNSIKSIAFSNGQLLYPARKLSEPTSNFNKHDKVKRGTQVILKCDDMAGIIYTIDGSIPSYRNGILYTKPIEITDSITIKAIAVGEHSLPSTIVTFIYDII